MAILLGGPASSPTLQNPKAVGRTGSKAPDALRIATGLHAECRLTPWWKGGGRGLHSECKLASLCKETAGVCTLGAK